MRRKICVVVRSQAPHLSAATTFQFKFDSFGRKIGNTARQKLLRAVAYLDIKSRVDMASPDNVFYFIEDHGKPPSPDKQPHAVYFGRHFGASQRGALINKFDIKTRKLIANTTMDPELSLIMSNMGKARPGTLTLDPFVGSGSMLFTSAFYGSMVVGTDINKSLLHGVGKTSRAKAANKFRSSEENLAATMEQYQLSHRFLGVLIADQSCPVWRMKPSGVFDSIITDPPYGIREGAKHAASVADPNVHFNVMQDQYQRNDVFDDLLDFAAQMLVLYGRLVYWLPVIQKEYDDAQVPTHPCLRLIANTEQSLSGRLARRLITMEKAQAWDPSLGGASTEKPLQGFRDKVFATPEAKIRRKEIAAANKLAQGTQTQGARQFSRSPHAVIAEPAKFNLLNQGSFQEVNGAWAPNGQGVDGKPQWSFDGHDVFWRKPEDCGGYWFMEGRGFYNHRDSPIPPVDGWLDDVDGRPADVSLVYVELAATQTAENSTAPTTSTSARRQPRLSLAQDTTGLAAVDKPSEHSAGAVCFRAAWC